MHRVARDTAEHSRIRYIDGDAGTEFRKRIAKTLEGGRRHEHRLGSQARTQNQATNIGASFDQEATVFPEAVAVPRVTINRDAGVVETGDCLGLHASSLRGDQRSAKKSFPLSSTMTKAGKSSTSIFQIASIPSSGYSKTSTFLMQLSARMAAGPPIDPR